MAHGGIITDYPDRLRGLLAQRGYRLPKAYAAPFDIQAHRGGRATRPENTLQVHDPHQGTVASADWYLRENPAYFHGPDVRTLQTRYGLKVIPYTVDDAKVMQRVIDLGVDGMITGDPDLLVSVAIRNGLR
ncbi:glycerophosphodiester phosphodiesterase family protein [Micromonospora sp. NBC_01638]|uniref:glycerophosphodiester phosphodiesterase family protein n=1 Tax=Micromonospora sp. NBC_01638 TaxID=2975982 RepID=UPI00386BC968|nr:glycerophosphodiester phosphodiesterase family protein [Micromonospora sp. NBC_01638]